MSNVNSIPALHRSLKEEHRIAKARLEDNIKLLSATSRFEVVGAAIYRDTIQLKVLTDASQALTRVSAGPNKAPLYRAKMYRDMLVDRMFETVDVTASPLVQAAESMRARFLRDLIREADGLIRDLEREE